MNAAEILALVASAFGGGGLVALVRPFLDYLKAKRGQTDEVAMKLVETLQTRIEKLEQAAAAERQLCDAKLSILQEQLKNVEGNFDSLLLAIEVAPEKAGEVVAKVKARRDRRAEETISALQDERGELRQNMQVRASADRVFGLKPKSQE